MKSLSAWYSNEKMILSDFSFSLAEHEVAGLIGLNGAGKTTFLKVLSGLLPTFCSEGICFCSSFVDFWNRDFKLCRYTVFAEDNSFSYFTFREYLAYVCAAYGKAVLDVSELIQGFHFEDYTDTLFRELPIGNRQDVRGTSVLRRPERSVDRFPLVTPWMGMSSGEGSGLLKIVVHGVLFLCLYFFSILLQSIKKTLLIFRYGN